MQKFDVMPDGEEKFSVVASSRDIAQWERTNKGSSFAELQRNMHMSDLYKIAWIASKRQGKFDGTLAEFQAQCDIRPDDSEDEEPDPTLPAA